MGLAMPVRLHHSRHIVQRGATLAHARSHLAVLRMLVILLPATIVIGRTSPSFAERHQARRLTITAYVLPRMTFSIAGSRVYIKSNVNWTAYGIAPDGGTIHFHGDGVRDVTFPSGTRDITVLYD